MRCFALGVCLIWLADSFVLGAEPGISFQKQIAPLLQAHCLKCHSGDRAKGDLDLTRRESILSGGAHGLAIVPGKAVESLLYQHVRDKKMPPKQPLEPAQVELLRRWLDAGAGWDGPPLKATALAEVRRAGLDWWSLQPIRRPVPPTSPGVDWGRNPIDAFILARLAEHGLTPSRETSRRDYIRRVSLDLIGLLPTPEEVEGFVNDRSAQPHEKLVDRLLASPHYGERWGRHWLDVVRFAESHGYEKNTLRFNAWPYRDYVIRAFNEDRPFRRFVVEQLAGDAVAQGDPLIDAATGFLVGGIHDMVGNATVEGKLQQRSDDLYDMVLTAGSAFLGLTVNCARCHDHKFDPITQRDYYGLEAVFAGVQHAERPIAIGDGEQRRREAEQVGAELAKLASTLDELEPRAGPPGSDATRLPVRPRRNVERFAPVEARFVRFTVQATVDGAQPCLDELEIYAAGPTAKNVARASLGARATASSVYPDNPLHKLKHVHDGRYGNKHSWISNEAGKGWVTIELASPMLIDRVIWGRDREQVYVDRLASEYRIEVSTDGTRWTAVAGSWDRRPFQRGDKVDSAATGPLKDMLAQRQELEKKLKALEQRPLVYAGTFHSPGPTHILKRGDPLQKREEVGPSAITAVGRPLTLDPKTPEQQRRLALAEWIADPANPLPARVIVNRVWHGHFGQGIMRTPSDFGFNGDRPSHPELLDWLAAEYQANGWQLKPLHRLIVLSSTYRQESALSSKGQAVDAGNRWLWRYAPRRLEAEAIRDTILQVAGTLNRAAGGPGYHLWEYSNYVLVFKPKAVLGSDEFRRMVYQFKPRTQPDETFGVFDCPDATQVMPRRNVSTTALQALNLLNSELVLDQSERFAQRLTKEAGESPEAQVQRGFLLAFSRVPSPREATAAVQLVREHGLAVFCRALFNANEFVFCP